MIKYDKIRTDAVKTEPNESNQGWATLQCIIIESKVEE